MFLVAGWISRQQLIVIEYLKAENRMLRERFNGRSLRFSDRERALLARKAFGIPRKVLIELGTIVTPDPGEGQNRRQSRQDRTQYASVSRPARK